MEIVKNVCIQGDHEAKPSSYLYNLRLCVNPRILVWTFLIELLSGKILRFLSRMCENNEQKDHGTL